MDEVGEYEAKRRARILQNQQMLRSLGIAAGPKERKRRVLARDESAAAREPRRSARLQQANGLRGPEDEQEEEQETLEAAPRQPKRARVTEYKPVALPTVEAPAPKNGKRSRQSSMLLDMDLAAFHERWLGKQIWPKGKATVMEGMCPQHVPMFGKMSGIQQWRNGVVLFVNVLGVSGYENSFAESPRPTADEKPAVHFRWFSQDRQTEQSPAIVRLLAAETGDHALWLEGASPPTTKPSTESRRHPVLLFLRHIDGPYIYCGRLGYLGHLSGSSPIEFRWQLLDVDKLDWSRVKELIDASDLQAEDAVVETA